MKIVTHGTVRLVILAFGLAFKIPYLFAREGLNGGFQEGRMSNLAELKHWKQVGNKEINGLSLCPIKFSLPFGLLNVMPRAVPFTWDEWKAMDFHYRYENFVNPAQMLGVEDNIKPDGYGRLDGKIVLLDYGWWVSPEEQEKQRRMKQEVWDRS